MGSDQGGDEVRDDIIVMKVMADDLDRQWWEAYHRALDQLFRQDVERPSPKGDRSQWP